MKWSFQIARVSGIEVRVHSTFLLLLAWYGYNGFESGGTEAAIMGVSFILLLFLCVLLHEFGHAFAARAFGIRTPDITLLPIGGVARLERMPSSPWQELVVAVAGPAVNVVIAAGLSGFLYAERHFGGGEMLAISHRGLLAQLYEVNIYLVLFNLIPAFPMDGGRILRALLAMRLSHATATRIAGRTGQGIAILFGIAGIFYNPFLFFIAVFVFMGAQQEVQAATFRQTVSGLSAGGAMITNFRSLPASATASKVLPEVLEGTQEIFPVVDDWLRPVGLVTRPDIVSLAERTPGGPALANFADPLPAVQAAASLEDAVAMMRERGTGILGVLNGAGQIVGLLTVERLGELSRAGA